MDPSQLECSICMEDYTSQGDHAPRLLMCGHSFCLSCLRDLPSKADGLPCPTCRKTTRLGPDGVEGLSANYALIELLGFLKPQKGGAGGAGGGTPKNERARSRAGSVDGKPAGERARSATVDQSNNNAMHNRARSHTVDQNREQMHLSRDVSRDASRDVSRVRAPSMQIEDDIILVEEKKSAAPVVTPVNKLKESKYEQEKNKEQERLRDQERLQREQKEIEQRQRELEQRNQPEAQPILAGEGVVGEQDVAQERHHFEFSKCCKCERPSCAFCRRISKRDWATLVAVLFVIGAATAAFVVAGQRTFDYLLDQL